MPALYKKEGKQASLESNGNIFLESCVKKRESTTTVNWKIIVAVVFFSSLWISIEVTVFKENIKKRKVPLSA